MPRTAFLECSVTANPVTHRRESISYKWIGKEHYLIVSMDLLEEIYGSYDFKKHIQIGPYKLIFCESLGFTALYIRHDKLGSLRAFLYRSTRWLDLAYRRMIITLAVWHLADYQEAAIPSWRDIKIFRKRAK